MLALYSTISYTTVAVPDGGTTGAPPPPPEILIGYVFCFDLSECLKNKPQIAAPRPRPNYKRDSVLRARDNALHIFGATSILKSWIRPCTPPS